MHRADTLAVIVVSELFFQQKSNYQLSRNFVEIINTMGLTSMLKINLFSKLTRQVFVKQYLSKSCNYSVNQIVPATDEFVWNTSNPVKIRMENTAPGNYPPMLVQTMMRNTVDKHGSRKAIGKVNAFKK